MATTPTQTTDLTEGYKYQQDRRTKLMINRYAKTMKKVKTSPRKPSGRGFVLGIETAASYNVFARNENQPIGNANSNEELQNPIITTKNLYAVVTLSGQAIAASKNYKDGFIGDTKQYAMDRIMATYYKLQNWHYFRNGEGTLGTVASVAGSVLTMKSPDYAFGIDRNMILDSVDAGGTSVVMSEALVTAVDWINNTVTVDSPGGVGADEELVIAGDRDTTATKNLTGLLGAIITSGTYFGVNVTTYNHWAGNRLANGSVLRPLTIELLQQAVDVVERVTGDEMPKFELCSNQGVRNKYLLLLHPAKRYVNTQELAGGHLKLMFNEYKWETDTDAPREKVFLSNYDHISKYQLLPGQWGDEEGIWMSLLRGGTGVDAVQAVWREYIDIGIDKPKSCNIIEDISEA